MPVRLIDRLSDKQVEELHALYAKEWWSQGRKLEDVRRMLAGASVVFAFVDMESGELAAFARALTDGVYRAHLFDVIVKESHRGRGLGGALMDAVVSHPTLRQVQKIILSCRPELAPFYQRWGFSEDLGGERYLERRAEKD